MTHGTRRYAGNIMTIAQRIFYGILGCLIFCGGVGFIVVESEYWEITLMFMPFVFMPIVFPIITLVTGMGLIWISMTGNWGILQ